MIAEVSRRLLVVLSCGKSEVGAGFGELVRVVKLFGVVLLGFVRWWCLWMMLG